MKLRGFGAGLTAGVALLIISGLIINKVYVTYLAPAIFQQPFGYLACGTVPAAINFYISILILSWISVVVGAFFAGYISGGLRTGLVAGFIIGLIDSVVVVPTTAVSTSCPALAGLYFPQLPSLLTNPLLLIFMALIAGGFGVFISSKGKKKGQRRRR